MHGEERTTEQKDEKNPAAIFVLKSKERQRQRDEADTLHEPERMQKCPSHWGRCTIKFEGSTRAAEIAVRSTPVATGWLSGKAPPW